MEAVREWWAKGGSRPGSRSGSRPGTPRGGGRTTYQTIRQGMDGNEDDGDEGAAAVGITREPGEEEVEERAGVVGAGGGRLEGEPTSI